VTTDVRNIRRRDRRTQTDTRLDNDAPWSAVKQRVTEKLAEAAEIFDAAETIHEWGGSRRVDGRVHREGSAIAFEHPDGAWFDQRGLGGRTGSTCTRRPAPSGRSRSARSSRRSATSIASIGV